ncbi:ABC transporter permease [Youngiibacter fragilis]|uniref:ABC transporter permease n=1 Tax=Youngiibacter fragilis 232.1 TaxID=994573 RepID=V7I5D4_9CLOT|nr:ABC transporter permease [Youngiibacter fragilis]ETA80187.1 ABC transporter permease [Youngiibacter fragilis 232.1]
MPENKMKNIDQFEDHDESEEALKEHLSSSHELGDEQRVKVLSPGMLVIKRFLRNRLAIIGFVIIAFMFLFSFLGGLLSPYGETEVFKHVGLMSKEYASITYNDEYRYTVADGMNYSGVAHSKFILARNSGKTTFTSGDMEYHIVQEGNEFYRIVTSDPVAKITNFRGVVAINPVDGAILSDAVKAAATEAINGGVTQFNSEGDLYTIVQSGREYILGKSGDAAIESKFIIDPAVQSAKVSYEFAYSVEKAVSDDTTSTFTVGGQEFEIEEEDSRAVIYLRTAAGREEYALFSKLAIQPKSPDIFLSLDFKRLLSDTITEGKTTFVFKDDTGADVEYLVSRLNNVYTVKADTLTHLISIHEAPSATHWLGTDKHGMDVITRLMYGGRISLTIGFIVVLLESILGVIMGGLAGYFGKWVDMLIMRIVDVFNCIPFMPLLIILGSVMDTLEVDPQLRIYYLMFILGVMSWPGIARMVRGQILSLREQEFMLAAEATGISVSRRIFKHLVPNVIPQLIVFATMGLGGVILYESTLSFLGLGVKFPLASWGNIISGVSTAYEMTNFWFVWIPAGTLILLTVLGFNFVGDGLRDAFDPKMKR